VTASGLALDHLTVTDTTPSQLVEAAAAAGARAVSLFMEPMAVLPRMPPFDLYGGPELRETRARLDGLGIAVDLVYPFTLAGRTEVANFRRALEAGAALGAMAANALLYDRDPARRFDRFAEFCALAAEYGLGVAAEFFPASQLKTLAEALDLTGRVGLPGVGVNLDLLHLVRSGGSFAEVAAAPPERLVYAQLCDAPADCEPERRDFEASCQRLYPGEGAFDVAGFAAALPPSTRVSVETPRDDLIAAGVSYTERARRALSTARAVI
jgi:sugar phosphate isomerase/epimerase